MADDDDAIERNGDATSSDGSDSVETERAALDGDASDDVGDRAGAADAAVSATEDDGADARQHRTDRDPRGDGTLLLGLRDVGHHLARAARRARRLEAGAAPHPLRHVRRRMRPTGRTASARTRSAK